MDGTPIEKSKKSTYTFFYSKNKKQKKTNPDNISSLFYSNDSQGLYHIRVSTIKEWKEILS